ncbi:MAG: hypothetical protein HC936_01665 [Leptolyngbyaceae cyanobacterium SU_3_3]|nr:hypothetical protein [Leptolyngbyaceae cyanobacterium SU_3_3]
MSKYSVLAARLKKELTKVQTTVQAAVVQANKAKDTGDLDYLYRARGKRNAYRN